MVTQKVGHVILNIPHSVVNSVVVSEKFLTQRNIVLIVLQDVNEREYTGVRTTHVIQLRVCGQELV